MAAGKMVLVSKAKGSNRGSPGIARKVKKLSRLVHAVMPETKHYPEQGIVNASPISTTATIVPLLNNIALGTAEEDRTANEISLRSITVPLYMLFATNASTATGWNYQTEVVRAMIVQDKQNSGSNPVIGDILDTSNATTPIQALRNVYNTKRFKFLVDRKFYLNVYNHATLAKALHKRFKYLKVEYNAAGDATKNQLYLILISDTNSANNNPVVSADLRVNYIDN